MKRKIISVICAFALCAGLAAISGCRPKGQKIAFFVYDGSDTFIAEMMGNMIEKVPDTIAVDIRDAGNSQAVQNQQVIELIELGGYSLFIINAVDRLACSSIVEKCGNEGIPVIFFNREPLGDALTGDNVYYVGADADSLGKKQADMVAELFGGEYKNSPYDLNGDGIIQLVILKGEQGHQDAEKRTENCVNRLIELGYRVDVLAIEVADWIRQDGSDAMRSLYKQFGDSIELVFSNNDDMALGAIDYLVAVGVFTKKPGGYDQPFLIVGVDGTTVGLDAIEQGLLYGSVNNDNIRQAEAILTLTECILSGKSLDDFSFSITNDHYIYIDGDYITLNNLADYAGQP